MKRKKQHYKIKKNRFGGEYLAFHGKDVTSSKRFWQNGHYVCDGYPKGLSLLIDFAKAYLKGDKE